MAHKHPLCLSQAVCRVMRRWYCSHLRISRMFPSPRGDLVATEGCLSQKLMIQNQLLLGASTGSFYMLPHTTRALEKLHRLIDKEMQSMGAQKIITPCLASGSMWKKSNRWNEMGSELFQLKDRNDLPYCLAPTHEEAVSSIVAAQSPISHKRLPIKLYQIGRKFRDEMRPKNGLLRCREFEMKDLYIFDRDDDHAQVSYDQVCATYENIFNQLDLPFIKVSASSGAMGGSKSDEFQLESDVGEDTLLHCEQCGKGFNKELEDQIGCHLPSCTQTFRTLTGIEVAHAFILGTRYSKTFNASYMDEEHRKHELVMGCFGIGVTRLLAAALEVLSTETELRWPRLLAPHQVIIIPQKEGYKSDISTALSEDLQASLSSLPNLVNEVVLDDRLQLSIGKRVKQARQMGYPYVVIAGKKILEEDPVFEVLDVNLEITDYLTKQQIMDIFSIVSTIVL